MLSTEEPYWAAVDRAQRHRGAPAELDNSFEALAEDSDDDNCDEVRIEPGHWKNSVHARDASAPYPRGRADVVRTEMLSRAQCKKTQRINEW